MCFFGAARNMNNLRKSYLDLMAETLAGTIHEDPAIPFPFPSPNTAGPIYDSQARELGLDWPSQAFTMIGLKRLRNICDLLETAIKTKIAGDFVETGVWRGGACIMARAVLNAYAIADRKVVLCDSFEGLPPPDPEKYPSDSGSECHTYTALSVPLETVKKNFSRFHLLDDQVVFIKGFFRETMANVPSRQIAILRLDGDMYESTIDPLNHLYDRISYGGWVIVDDYHVIPAAKQAVHDFLDSKGIKAKIEEIDGTGVFFRKTKNGM